MTVLAPLANTPESHVRKGVSPPENPPSELTENGPSCGTVGANVLTLDAKKASVAPAQRFHVGA